MIVQWILIGAEHFQIVIHVDNAGEARVVIGRPTDHGKDFTCVGMHGDHHTGLGANSSGQRVDLVDAPGQRLLGSGLQFRIEGEAQVLPRQWLAAADFAQDFPGHIDLAQNRTAHATQFILHKEFHASVADAVEEGIVALLLQRYGILCRDGPHVADDLGGEGAGRIAANTTDVDVYAWQGDAFLQNLHRRRGRNILRHDHRPEGRQTLALKHQLLDAAHAAALRQRRRWRYVHQCGQPRED